MYIIAQGPVSEMTYTVSSGTLNSSIPYHTIPYLTIVTNEINRPRMHDTVRMLMAAGASTAYF